MIEILLNKFKRLWLIGIGGSGMSGMAEFLLSMGFKIAGSDQTRSDVTDRLASLGATIYIGHDPRHVRDVDVVVYSSAVRPDNVELIEALDRKIPVIRRAEMLAEFLRMKPGIAVSGSHGKTTVTSLVGEVLSAGGLDPTVIVGGRLNKLGGSMVSGKGDLIVVEADEYDQSFLRLSPVIVLVNNIDTDHIECYGSYDELVNAFVRFANSVPFYGRAMVCLDEPSLHPILPRLQRTIVTYGFSPQADVRAEDASYNARSSTFKVNLDGKTVGSVELPLPGVFNIRNALGALAIGHELGVKFNAMKSALEGFKGVHRRFEVLGEPDGIMVVSDFGHHPTAVAATLEAARAGWSQRRIIAVFQAHLFSRTQMLATQFGQALLGADTAYVLPIYPAREDPIPGVTGRLIYDAARQFGHKDVRYVEDKSQVVEEVLAAVRKNDILLVIGAGNIHALAVEIHEALVKK